MIADCGSSVPSWKPSALRPAWRRLRILPQMRALVVAVHQLADRGRGGGDHDRRQRGGEHIGPADQPQDLELGMVGDAEAADRADALGEGADDEIDLVEHALRPRTRRGRARRRSPSNGPRRPAPSRRASWRPRPSPSAARCRRASNRRPRARPACRRLRREAAEALVQILDVVVAEAARSRHCPARSRHRSRRGCRCRG